MAASNKELVSMEELLVGSFAAADACCCACQYKKLGPLARNFAEIKLTTDFKKKMEMTVELAHPLYSEALCIVRKCITNQQYYGEIFLVNPTTNRF